MKTQVLAFWTMAFGKFIATFILVIMKGYLFSRILSSSASKYLREGCQINLITFI